MQISLQHQSRTHASQLGAIYVVFAVGLFALIGVAALVIDISMALSSQEQQLHNCEYAALAALKEFDDFQPNPLVTDPLDRYRLRLEAALARGNQISQLNRMISPQVSSDTTPFDELGLDRTSFGGLEEWQAGGILVPGRWLSGAGNCGGAPRCFVKNTLGDLSVSAFECRAKLETPIRTIIAKVIGQENLWIQARAVSAFTPQSFVFLLDASGSMHYETHLINVPYQPGDALGALTWQQSSQPPADQLNYWDGLNDTRLAPGPNTVHYKSDYQPFYFNPADLNPWTCPNNLFSSEAREFISIPGFPSFTACTLVDIETPMEPLNTMLTSIDSALVTLENNFPMGGRAGILVFDQRIFPDNSGIRTFPLGTAINDLRANVTNLNSLQERARRLLFPLPGALTDIYLALNRARNWLLGEVAARKNIILITDGLPSCHNGVCVNFDNTGAVINSYANNILNFANQLRQIGIKVHVILTGQRDRAHSYNIQRQEYTDCCIANGENPNGYAYCPACRHIGRWMDYQEAMEINTDFVSQQSLIASYPLFMGANKLLYELAKRTGGGFYPVRPSGTGACCPNTPGEETLCADHNVWRTAQNPPQLQFLDPLCRSTAQQVADFMAQSIAEKDIRLVD